MRRLYASMAASIRIPPTALCLERKRVTSHRSPRLPDHRPIIHDRGSICMDSGWTVLSFRKCQLITVFPKALQAISDDSSIDGG